jgi:hypothetical protein
MTKYPYFWVSGRQGAVQRRPEPSQVADFADISRSQIAFDNEELVRRRAFALIIPIDDLVVDVGSGAWSTTLQVVTTYRNANEPEVITPNELALMVEPELVISDMSPLLSRGSVSGWVDDEHYSILLENQIENPRSLVDGLQFRRDPNVTHTINRGVLNLKMRSPRFEATRDTLLLVFSTLFGIAIGGLIEAFLVSSLRIRSPEVPVVKTKQHSQSAKDRATNTNSSQTGN